MEIGTQFQCEIEKTAFGGDGIVRVDGEVVFIPGALPGEKLIAEVIDEKKNFSRAKIVRFGQTSPVRREPECPYFGRCVNCCYLHCSYEEENRLKLEQFRDLAHSAGVELPEEVAVFGPEPEIGYRNKMVLHARKIGKELFFGYVREDNESVTDIERCLLANPALNEELLKLRKNTSFLHSLHDHMDVTLRLAAGGVSTWRNQPPRNATWLREQMSFGELSVPAGSFFQVNPAGAEKLAEEVGKLVREYAFEQVMDLYCGAGFFASAAVAAGVKKCILVESDDKAVEAARFNLRKFGVENAECVADDAVKWLKKGNGELNGIPTLTIVDPPRAGLARGVAESLASGGVTHLASISCNPGTWNRDALRLIRNGFQLKKALVVNMFPRTEHFEIFSFFVREDA